MDLRKCASNPHRSLMCCVRMLAGDCGFEHIVGQRPVDDKKSNNNRMFMQDGPLVQ